MHHAAIRQHIGNGAGAMVGHEGRRRSPRLRRLARSALATLCLGLPAAAFTASPAAAAAGALDASFDTDGKVTTDIGAATADTGNDVAVQPDGKIVVVGTSANDFAVARYNSNGSLDTSFDTDGKVTTDIGAGTGDVANAVAIQPDGKIVVAGESNNDFAVVRYNANGSLDTGFDTDGKVTTDIGTASDDGAWDVAIQPDGKIVAAGYTSSGGYDFAVVRYNANGSLDTSFDTDGKVNTDIGTGTGDTAFAVALQPDGKIVAAGIGGVDFAVVRYNANGSPDTGFDTDGEVTTDFAGGVDTARGVAIQPDGKIVAAGSASTNDFGVVRYNGDGSLDTSFDTDGKVTTDIGGATIDLGSDVVVQADGKIVVSGSTSSGGGDFAVVRYNPNGSLDTSFDGDGKVVTDIGAGTADVVNAVALQPDGRIVAAGTSANDFAVVRYENEPAASINDVTVAEGDFGNRIATFTVTLSSAPATATTVAYATADGTATAGVDYTATSGTLNFAAGDTTETIAVTVRGDGVDEADETFFVNLSSPTNVSVLTKAQGVGTIVDDDPGPGYWLVASDGGVFSFDAPFSGSTGNIKLNQPIVGMAADPDGKGYWFVASDGGVFAFDATFHGSMGATKLNQPIVGMAADPDGKGYWLVAKDGGIFSFEATFSGSTGNIKLNQPIVGMTADPDGKGYWFVASDGGVFAFDATFAGSMGATKLNQPVVGMDADPDGKGYWLVAKDGGIFSFDATFSGSTGSIRLNQPIVGMTADPDGKGYWFVASDGGVFAFDAVFKGSMGATRLNQPVVGMAART